MQRGRAVQRNNPTYKIETVSSVYPNVNIEKGKEWYESEDWTMPLGDPKPYELVDWIGTGKYSDVFKAVKGDQAVAIKVLKPVRPAKYNREAKILLNLRDGTNIVRLEEIVQNPVTQQYSFIFEHVNDTNFNSLIDTITDHEARFYLFHLMKALSYSHSHGIMHRDVKPANVLYDRQSQKLRLIDWGLADFYFPQKRYNIHVASRNFKPIELLLDYQCYDYSIDIWSFGVTMASIIFKKTPFFRGKDDIDMVSKIAGVLGGDKLKQYMEKYDLPTPDSLQKGIFKIRAKSWTTFIKANNKELANPEALDLLDKCMRFDHTERITAEEALSHPYFAPVRDAPYR